MAESTGWSCFLVEEEKDEFGDRGRRKGEDF